MPVDVDGSVPEQRILEASVRLRGDGAVTGWAALRMRGAAYFDGRLADGDPAPVPLVSSRQLRRTVGVSVSRAAVDPDDIDVVQGVAVVGAARALIDHLGTLSDTRARIVAVDMALAARITSLRRLRRYAALLRGERRRVLLATLEDADEGSESPKETELRLVWERDAGAPRPLVNRLVYALDGRLLGKPDLLDPGLGVVGEYDGAPHRARERKRRDVTREDLFRRAGLECLSVVAGDSVAVQIERIRATRARAQQTPRPRWWTLDPPPGAWVPRGPSLEEELDVADAVREQRRAAERRAARRTL